MFMRLLLAENEKTPRKVVIRDKRNRQKVYTTLTLMQKVYTHDTQILCGATRWGSSHCIHLDNLTVLYMCKVPTVYCTVGSKWENHAASLQMTKISIFATNQYVHRVQEGCLLNNPPNKG